MSSQNNSLNQFSVVGAGPGDPELITLKGVKALQEADVILYDALANEALLDHARPEAMKRFVGKRRGAYAYSQEEINEMIADYALTGAKVVRLKGGDPFIFGRGMEEILYAKSRGIETAYIPGVSSAVAAPGVCGIPLTHRGLSESFSVVTATNERLEISNDLKSALLTGGTVVVLMGLSKLEEIVQIILSILPADTPTAIIQNGSLPSQKIVAAKTRDIVALAMSAVIGAPAIIIVGAVVGLCDAYQKQTREQKHNVV